MIVFLLAITILTMLSAGCTIFIKKKIITNYRGGLMILLSGVYFALFFYIAHLMRESFK
jgi:hypothetical protein